MISGSFVLDPSANAVEMTTTAAGNSSSAAGSPRPPSDAPETVAVETSDKSGGVSGQNIHRRAAAGVEYDHHPSLTGGPSSSRSGGRSVIGGSTGKARTCMPGQRRPRAVSASTAAGSPPAGASSATSPAEPSPFLLPASASSVCAGFVSRERTTNEQQQHQQPALGGLQIQDAPTPTPSLPTNLLPNHPNHPNILPVLHQNLDAAYERLSALLDRECAQTHVYGLGLKCHVPRPRLMVRKKRRPAAAAAADGTSTRKAMDAEEGRQPNDECEMRPRFASTTNTNTTTTTTTTTTSGGIDHGQAILREILLQVRADEEVEEIYASDVGLVYHHAGLDRSGDHGHGGVVAHLRCLAREFRESDEVVEIAMSYLDRYLMAKADRTGLFCTNHVTLLSGANNNTSSSTSTPSSLSSTFRATFTPGWSIVYASLACLQIAIKTHSPHGARLSHRPRSFMAPMYWNCLDTVYGLDGGGCLHHPDDPAADVDAAFAARPRPDLMDRCRISIEDRMVAYLMSVGGNSNVHWCAHEIREVFARTEAYILHTLEFRLIPTTSWGVARDMIDLVETSVQIERLAYEQFRQRQAAMVAETAMQEETDESEVDKDHRLAGPGPAAAAIPPPYPVNIDSSRLTKLSTQQLTSALHDNDLLSIPRSILARAAVQNALVHINNESKATNALAGTSTKAELQAQYEDGCAIVGRLAGALRGACSVPYGEAVDMDWNDSTEEEYEKEAMFQVAVQSLGKHLNHIVRREAMEMAAQNEKETAAQTIGRGTEESPPCVANGFSHVVTPSATSGMERRLAGDEKKNRTTKMNVEKVAKSYGSGSTCTADTALDFASERHYRAKKKAKKNGGVARLTTGYSPGYGGSGRVILE